jgi:hypothetical protein
MGVRRFRSVEEMPGPPPRRPLDPENLLIAFGLVSVANGFSPVAYDPGVRKFRSWEEAVVSREQAARARRKSQKR